MPGAASLTLLGNQSNISSQTFPLQAGAGASGVEARQSNPSYPLGSTAKDHGILTCHGMPWPVPSITRCCALSGPEVVISNTEGQVIEGFGGAFTESSAAVYKTVGREHGDTARSQLGVDFNTVNNGRPRWRERE